jgi:transposase-like protein
MATAYSMDLRERLVEAVEREGLSCNQAAARFAVAVSTAIDWVNRYRRTGSAAPGGWGATGRRSWSVSTATGWCSAAGSATSPCAGWSPSWLPAL